MKYLISAFLLAFAVVSPANASTKELLNALVRSGAKITIDSQYCKQSRNYGAYFWNERTIHLCLDRHNEDPDELTDTIKHEAVHHVQNCVDGQLVYRESFIHSQSTPKQRRDASLTNQYGLELEAAVVADNASTDDIVYLINKYCSNANTR